MKIKNIIHSLKFKMLLVTLASIILAVGIFMGSFILGNFLVWKYYLDDNMVQKRVNQYIGDFQEYVTANRLFTTDMNRINAWVSSSRYMELVIYKDSQLIYSPEWFEKVTEASTGNVTEETSGYTSADSTQNVSEMPTGSQKPNYGEGRDFRDYLNEDSRKEYENTLSDILDGNRELSPVVFTDGTLLVTVVDYSENLMHSGVIILSFALAFTVLMIVMMIAFSKLTMRITRLAANVKMVERGDMGIPIYSKGKDEIATLASDINSMRKSIVSNMSKEREAWEANAELITAMSHDIRTPLTVMMGYLDLMELQCDDETMAEYLNTCRENAVKLKKLSDDMFRYFLVFGRKELDLELCKYPAQSVVHHMLDEHIILLEEQGYVTVKESDDADGEICVDLINLGRVVDNIFSNIRKYADKDKPVKFSVYVSDGRLNIKVENFVTQAPIVESNEIGLKTCHKIMEQMGGEFVSQRNDNTFIATVSLPISKND